jgi:TPR repeat protein
LKLAADQAFAVAQNNYGICLQRREDILKELNGASHYLHLAADQRSAHA